MPDWRDIVEVGGTRVPQQGEASSLPANGPRRAFLAVWFRCCHVYGRMYRDAEGTRYDGRCPKCGAAVHAMIGPEGTSRRVFEAR